MVSASAQTASPALAAALALASASDWDGAGAGTGGEGAGGGRASAGGIHFGSTPGGGAGDPTGITPRVPRITTTHLAITAITVRRAPHIQLPTRPQILRTQM